jgi:hypothetical protein
MIMLMIFIVFRARPLLKTRIEKGLSIMPANRSFTQPGQPIVAIVAGPLVPCVGMQGVVILVVSPGQHAAWQEIYRLAAERARQALEVPRHHRRFFSVWN